MKCSSKNLFSNCDQIYSHMLKQSLMENFIFYAVLIAVFSSHYNNVPSEKSQLKSDAIHSFLFFSRLFGVQFADFIVYLFAFKL